MAHTSVSFPSTSNHISPMLTLVVDLCTCSTATMDGGLISLIEYLLMKLDTFSTLPMSTLMVNAIATEIMAEALAVQGIKTVLTVQVLRAAA